MEYYLAIHPSTHSTICVFPCAPPFAMSGYLPTIHDVEAPDSQAWLQLQDLAKQGKGIKAVKIPPQIKEECERLLNTSFGPEAASDPLCKFSEDIRRYHARVQGADDHLKPRTAKAYRQGRKYSTERLTEEVQMEIITRIKKGQCKTKIAVTLGISRSSVYRYCVS